MLDFGNSACAGTKQALKKSEYRNPKQYQDPNFQNSKHNGSAVFYFVH